MTRRPANLSRRCAIATPSKHLCNLLHRGLIYATGGLAVGQIHADYTDGLAVGLLTPAAAATASGTVTRAGWVLGAGFEEALTDRWSVKVEYLHVDLGRFSGSPAGITTGSTSLVIGSFTTTLAQSTAFGGVFNTHFTDDILRVGVNYRFAAH